MLRLFLETAGAAISHKPQGSKKWFFFFSYDVILLSRPSSDTPALLPPLAGQQKDSQSLRRKESPCKHCNSDRSHHANIATLKQPSFTKITHFTSEEKICSPSQGVSTLIYSTRAIQQKNKGSFTKLHILLSFPFIMLCYETHLLLSA